MKKISKMILKHYHQVIEIIIIKFISYKILDQPTVHQKQTYNHINANNKNVNKSKH